MKKDVRGSGLNGLLDTQRVAWSRKTISALLKLMGAAMLLASFIAQNFFYDISNTRSAELLQAMRDRQLIDKGALLHQVLYFSAINSEGKLGEISASEVAASMAAQAALKISQSFSVGINAARTLGPDKSTAVLRPMFAKAGQVKDYTGLVSFIDYVNKFVAPYEQLDTEFAKVIETRESARIVYLLLYIVSSLILLSGLYFDWRGVEE